MTITITPAALHAALGTLRKLGGERENDSEAAAFFIDGMLVIEALLDPAHQLKPPARMDLHDIIRAPRFPGDTTFGHTWPEDIGSAMHAPPAPLARAAPVQGNGAEPGQDAAGEAIRPEAGTPAPPTIELSTGPGPERPSPARPKPQDGAPAAPEAPPPAQVAAGQPHPSRPGKWSRDRIERLATDLPTCTDRPALLAGINAMPGEPIASVKAIMVKAANLGIKAEAWASRAIEAAAGIRGGTASIKAVPVVAPTQVRTPERIAAFPALWNDSSLTVGDIHRRLNAMPGDHIKASQQLYGFAKKLGLSTHRPMLDEALRPPPAEAARQARATAEPAATEESPLPEPAIDTTRPPEPEAPPPPPMPDAPPRDPPPRGNSQFGGASLPAVPDDKAEAFQAFDAGQTVRDVAADTGLPLSTLSNWQAQWRLARRKDSAL